MSVDPEEARREPVRAWVIALLVAATLGAGITTLVPMTYTLALKLEAIAPGREQVLGYILGANAVTTLLTSPLTGMLSDRTRTRWGRRHPYTVGGIIVGVTGLPLMIVAGDAVTLAAGWIVASLGFGTAMASISNFLADRLPPSQRGRVSGVTGFASHVAPVVGILVAGSVADDIAWAFLLPSGIGIVLMLGFVLLVHEADSRGLTFDEPLSFARIVRSYGFRPREAPDFAWSWLGRFILFLGLALTTSYSTYFYAQRLGVAVADLAPLLAITSAASIAGAAIGAIGAGVLTDRTGRRRPLVLLAVCLFGAGAVVSAFAWSLAPLIIGSFATSTGVAAFQAVSQAITLDVLPGGAAEAGRYMAIARFSQRIPTALAPLLAPPLLMLTAQGAQLNYTILYVCSAVLAVSGGSLIAWRVRGVR